MANIIEVETGTLASDVVSLRELIEEVWEKKRKLITCMFNIDVMWDGPANDEYIAQYKRDDDAFDELLKSLIRAVDCMDYARSGYDKCEEEVSDIIAAINI
ncbi:MAG: hypothetical protein E7554_00590 [Ruminococcaceae bacterium]|nr:hypothetical protein [Oscillospiraceae bacterium]